MLVCISAEEELTETSPQDDEGYGKFTQGRTCIRRFTGKNWEKYFL